jgi:hypothetical protein
MTPYGRGKAVGEVLGHVYFFPAIALGITRGFLEGVKEGVLVTLTITRGFLEGVREGVLITQSKRRTGRT